MNIDIVFSKSNFSDILLKESSKSKDYRLMNLQAGEGFKLLMNNRVDIALLSPLELGMAQKSGDFRVIASSCLISHDYSGLMGIKLKEGLQEIKTVGSNSSDPYLFAISKIIFNERYGIDFGELEINDTEADIYISNSGDETVDLSEDWFDLMKIPLPLLCWVCKADNEKFEKEDAIRITNEISILEDLNIQSEDGMHKGNIIRQWADDIEKVFDDTLEILFYNGILPEMYACKKFGDDALEEDLLGNDD